TSSRPGGCRWRPSVRSAPTASWPPRCGRRLRVTWRRKPDGRQNSGCGRRRRRPHGESRCASGRRGSGYDAGRSAGPRARGRAGRWYGGGHGTSWRQADRGARRHPRREAGCPHRVLAARGSAPAPAVKEEETITGARGGRADGIRVHSVRLPGLVAHQEVIFGGPGQTLVIRHDSVSEESFMPGLMLAARKVRSLTGLVYGLEKLLEL